MVLDSSPRPNATSYSWSGADEPCLDEVRVDSAGSIVIGRFGGATSRGASYNEDAAWVRTEPGMWELAAVLDAHASSDSSYLVLETLENLEPHIRNSLAQDPPAAFRSVSQALVGALTERDFIDRARSTRGETAFLIAVRREHYLWWLSVGDCMLYLLHPELAALGQFAVTQRNFYEWVGHASAFNEGVPCFTEGVRELRTGGSVILLTTDGLLESGDRRYENPSTLYDALTSEEGRIDEALGGLLEGVREMHGRDSATIVAWSHANEQPALMPST